MALMNGGGKVDPRFNALNVMEKFGWTFQQYIHRPAWFDPLYEIKQQSEDKYHEIKGNEAKGSET